MYKYRINNIDVEFKNESDMMAAVEAARAKGYSIEVISEPEGPQTQAEAEASQSEVVEEGFSLDFQPAAPDFEVAGGANICPKRPRVATA